MIRMRDHAVQHEIGHAPAKLAPVEVKVWENDKDSRPCSIDMESSTLPLTSPCSGTKRKTAVPFFRKYRRAQIALFHTYTASVASTYCFSQSFASPSSIVLAISDYSLSCPYCISLPFIIFTVLLFAKEKYKESTAEFKKPQWNRYFICSTTVIIYCCFIYFSA